MLFVLRSDDDDGDEDGTDFLLFSRHKAQTKKNRLAFGMQKCATVHGDACIYTLTEGANSFFFFEGRKSRLAAKIFAVATISIFITVFFSSFMAGPIMRCISSSFWFWWMNVYVCFAWSISKKIDFTLEKLEPTIKFVRQAEEVYDELRGIITSLKER